MRVLSLTLPSSGALLRREGMKMALGFFHHRAFGVSSLVIEDMDQGDLIIQLLLMISIGAGDLVEFEDTCVQWNVYTTTEIYLQDDSGV
jgi:hypothetical protein